MHPYFTIAKRGPRGPYKIDPSKRIPVKIRFFEKVKKTNACWLWTGCIHRQGYGEINVNGKSVLAHRVSWEIHNGAIPPNMKILHHCDIPPCVNPRHLFLGTQKDNMIDCFRKGRGVAFGIKIKGTRIY